MPSVASPRSKCLDLAVGALPLGLGGESLDPLDEHPAVPGAVEHRHPAPARERRGEAPQEVVAALALGRGGELGDGVVPGVQRRGQPADRAALAGGVPALEQDGERRSEVPVADLAAGLQAQRGQPALGVQQALARLAAETVSG